MHQAAEASSEAMQAAHGRFVASTFAVDIPNEALQSVTPSVGEEATRTYSEALLDTGCYPHIP